MVVLTLIRSNITDYGLLLDLLNWDMVYYWILVKKNHSGSNIPEYRISTMVRSNIPECGMLLGSSWAENMCWMDLTLFLKYHYFRINTFSDKTTQEGKQATWKCVAQMAFDWKQFFQTKGKNTWDELTITYLITSYRFWLVHSLWRGTTGLD